MLHDDDGDGGGGESSEVVISDRDELELKKCHISPVRLLAINFQRTQDKVARQDILFSSMARYKIGHLTFPQRLKLEHVMRNQLEKGVFPEHLVELYKKDPVALRRVAFDLDIKHDGRLTDEWLLTLLTAMIWHIGRLNSQKICFLVLIAGNEIECVVQNGKVRRSIKRVSKTNPLAPMLKFDEAKFATAQELAQQQQPATPPTRRSVYPPIGVNGVDCGEGGGDGVDRKEAKPPPTPQAAPKTHKKGVHVYTNIFMQTLDTRHLVAWLTAAIVQHFGDDPPNVGLTEPLRAAFDDPTSLRLPGNNKMVKCPVCTKQTSHHCPACLGSDMVDAGKPYCLSWVITCEKGQVEHDDNLLHLLRTNFNLLLEATRLNYYEEAPPDRIGSHIAKMKIPDYILEAAKRAYNGGDAKNKSVGGIGGSARHTCPGVDLNVAAMEPLMVMVRKQHPGEWDNLLPCRVTMYKDPAGSGSGGCIDIKFGGYKLGDRSNGAFYCHYGKRNHDSLPLFLSWTRGGVTPHCCICNPPKGSVLDVDGGGVLEIEQGGKKKVAARPLQFTQAESIKLHHMFIQILQPEERQLPQAKKRQALADDEGGGGFPFFKPTQNNLGNRPLVTTTTPTHQQVHQQPQSQQPSSDDVSRPAKKNRRMMAPV